MANKSSMDSQDSWRASVYDASGVLRAVNYTPTVSIWSKKTDGRKKRRALSVPEDTPNSPKRKCSKSASPAGDQSLPTETSSPSSSSSSELSTIDMDREIDEIWALLQYGYEERYMEAVQKLDDLGRRTRSNVLTWQKGRDRNTLLHIIASKRVSELDAIFIQRFLDHLKKQPRDLADAIKTLNSWGQTPLIAAIFHNTDYVWRSLLDGSIPRDDMRVALRSRTNTDSTVLHTAASRDDDAFLEFFFAGAADGSLGLASCDVAELLNVRCKLPSDANGTRVTPLEFAIVRKRSRAAEVLQCTNMQCSFGVASDQLDLLEQFTHYP
ncbi:hypothetical protein HDU87_004365 [Geranomyces variabilis]|uniref:Ankyrin repeat protein n=1 Tax=Geranomyces variabilis TaxID=109894 RepID=A0AAD5XQ04_9FUNG|nr:hypothetical protein HDU87_004365 [Geranomyces variabilis]